MSPEINVPPVVHQDFAFKAGIEGGGVRIGMTGAADARATTELETFLRNTHEEARRLAVAEVCVDLTGLSFMNSSCFRAFVGWLYSVQEMPAEAQYQIRFAWDGKSYWQRRSLQALKTFASTVVQI